MSATVPTECPWCGTVEPNRSLLQSNHWVKAKGDAGFDWCETNQMCIAMELTRNHVRYMAKQPLEIRVAQLPAYIARARTLWMRAGAEWLDEFESMCRPITAPENRPIVAFELEEAMF